MNKKKIFYGIADLCIDAVNLSRNSVEKNAIEAAFRCFDAAVNALDFFAERKATDALYQSTECYLQSEKLYEEAAELNARDEIQRAGYAEQEAWEKKLVKLKEDCTEQRNRLELNKDDCEIIRNIGQKMLHDLRQVDQIVEQRREQLSATEEMVNKNQKEIARLDEVLRDSMLQCKRLMTCYETGGK